MIVVLTVVLIGLGAGLIAGGSVRNFDRVHVFWWGAALIGLLSAFRMLRLPDPKPSAAAEAAALG